MPVYKDSRGRWRFRFFRAGLRYSGSAPASANTKRAAETLERASLERVIAGRHQGPAPTVHAFAPRFLAHQAARTKPLTQQKATVTNLIVPLLGHLRLDEVDKAQIDQLVTAWRESLAPKTINARLGTLRRMLSLAVEWNLIQRVPKIQFLRLPKERPRFLTDAEARGLVAAAEPLWKAMILVALRTGLRVGELRGLQWSDVDFGRRVITVRRTDPGRPRLDSTAPKGNSQREVPLSPEAATELELLPRPAARRRACRRRRHRLAHAPAHLRELAGHERRSPARGPAIHGARVHRPDRAL
jgi:integrase